MDYFVHPLLYKRLLKCDFFVRISSELSAAVRTMRGGLKENENLHYLAPASKKLNETNFSVIRSTVYDTSLQFAARSTLTGLAVMAPTGPVVVF